MTIKIGKKYQHALCMLNITSSLNVVSSRRLEIIVEQNSMYL